MHTEMWQHPATQANVATLRSRGVTVLDPAVGRLTGAGLRPRPAARTRGDLRRRHRPLADGTLHRARRRSRLGGARNLCPRVGPPAGPAAATAAAARWPAAPSPSAPAAPASRWIPVRFLGNRSSGKQGVALARAAARRRCRRSADRRPHGGSRPRRRRTGARWKRPWNCARPTLRAAARLRRRHHGRRRGGFPPGRRLRQQDQEARRRRRPVITLVRNPDILRGARAGPRRRSRGTS